MSVLNTATTPVVIFCGGRLVDIGASERGLKALAPVAGHPLVHHVVRHYVHHGFRQFIFAAGLQEGALRDAVAPLAKDGVTVTVVDTGAEATTGQRLARVASQVGSAPVFAVTYSDTVSTVDLAQMHRFHLQHGQLATVAAARMPTRFKVLGLRDDDDVVKGFASRPVIPSAYINGGYYLFSNAVLREPTLTSSPSGRGPVLEEEVIGALASRGQLLAWRHEGAWQHFDSPRDLPAVEAIAKATP